MRLSRKPSASDSDAESQPLTSSISSTASFGTVNERCIFPQDSDMTDNEFANQRRCMSDQELQNMARFGKSTSPDFSFLQQPSHNVCNRLQYFYKGSKSVIIDDSLLPRKLMTFQDFKDASKNEESFEHVTVEEPTQSSLVTIFAIWNTIMGSSLLAISWGLEKAGLVPGIILILLIAAICLYTSYVILKVNESYGIYRNNEVPDLCRLLIGRWAEMIAKIFSLIVLIGANIVYWILMSNFLYNSVTFVHDYIYSIEDTLVTNSSYEVICPKNYQPNTTLVDLTTKTTSSFDTYWNLNSTVPVFLCILMFPLLNFKSPTFFTKFNSLGTISVCYVVLLVITKGATWGVHIPDWSFEFDIKANFSALSGMLSLSFFIHNIIISICKNNRHQENNGRDLSIAFILVTLTYLIVGVVFYICFPMAKSCIEDNILNNLSKFDTMTIIARMLLLFQLFTVFPLISFMLRVNILNNAKAIFGNEKFGEFTYTRVIILNIIVVVICTLFACFLPHIGTLIRYTGALSGMVYIFTLPNLLKIAALKRENALTAWKFILHAAIICIGAANLALQFFVS